MVIIDVKLASFLSVAKHALLFSPLHTFTSAVNSLQRGSGWAHLHDKAPLY